MRPQQTMAEDLSTYEIYWTKEEQENDILNDNVQRTNSNRQVLGKMEGNSQNGNGSKVKDDHHQIPEKDTSTTPVERKTKKSRHPDKPMKVKEKPSLKDLRPEDKKRVANLIRELAKAGEEKEVALEQLQVERQEYEHHMKDLHFQVDGIAKEREIVQKQYLECQKLLANYQAQLAEEQEKVSRMNNIIKSTPVKHRPKQHTSPLSQGVLAGRSPSPNIHQRSPASYAQPTSSSRHSYHDHHQPSLNGYPPPPQMSSNHVNQPYPQGNGYQPLIFHNQSNGYDGGVHVPRGQNGVTSQTHYPIAVSQNADVAADFNFQPVLSSTQRSSHRHHAKSSKRHKEHVSRLYAIHNQKLPSSQPSSSSPDFLLSGHSRTNSGDFQPLLPEPDNDSESTSPLPPPLLQNLDENEFLPLPFDTRSTRTWPEVSQSTNPSSNQYNPQEVPPENFRSLTPQHRQKELMKQRTLLEEEQAWLRQKLAEQEKLLAVKQAQLTETELLYLQTGDPKCNAPSLNVYPNSSHVGLGVEPPPVQRQPYGLYPTAQGDAVSTNFPPEEFDEFGQSKFLIKSMHELGLGHESSHHSHHEWSPSSETSDSRHKRRSHDGRRSSRRKESYEEVNRAPSRAHGQFDGYASFHSASKSKRKHRGSISSSPSTTSTSTMSSNRHHHRNKLKHMATSPLYRDAGTAVSPNAALSPEISNRPALSPGKVEVTRAPTNTSFSRLSVSPMTHQHPSRQQGNLSLPSKRTSPSSPSTPSTTTHHRETLQLTDLIDTLDGSPGFVQAASPRTHHRPVSRLHNGSSRSQHMARSPFQLGPTPELYSMEDGIDMEVDQQESRMLEEVFFVV